MRVESGPGTEVLLHPGEGLVAHGERLCDHDSDKRADRPRHEKEKEEKRQNRGERAAAADQPRDPFIKRRA